MVREKQNVREVFFAFLFFISKAHYMRWKTLNLLRSVFMDRQSFFDLVILSIF
jgi:hypothetical protein